MIEKLILDLILKAERDYKKEYEDYHAKPEQVKRRQQRNASRNKLVKSGKCHKGDNRDVHHKDHNANNMSLDNLSITSKEYNRSRNSKTPEGKK